MNLICIGVDHHANSVEARERLSLSGETLEMTLHFFSAHRSFSEMVILSTCNRVEFYTATRMTTKQAVSELKESLKDFLEIRDSGLEKGFVYRNDDAVRHLFEVCSGLQSMVIGETEIFGQAKGAYQLAKKVGSAGPVLNRLFQTAFNAAKEVRTTSAIGRGSVSVASVAVQAAGRIVGSLKTKKVLVLGAGDTGEKVTEALSDAGAKSLFCSNRRTERAVRLSEKFNMEIIPWNAWKGRLCTMDIIVCSTSAPEAIMEFRDLVPFTTRFSRQPLLVIDLAVPRDVDPNVAKIPGVCLLNVDDLKQVASEKMAERLKEREVALEILEPRAAKLVELFYKNSILEAVERPRAHAGRGARTAV